MTNIYSTNKKKLSGTSYKEIDKLAKNIYSVIRKRTKRTPYLRSKYFRSEKVFLNIFWSHLYQKHEKDRTRRLKFFDCAVDLIKSSTYHPVSRENFKNKGELLHRFVGSTKNKEKFIVQIKENKRSKRKDLVSVYPE